MDAAGNKSINEVGGTELAALQSAFEAAMAFVPPAPPAMETATVLEKAKNEAFSDPVRTDEHGLSAGMRSLLAQLEVTLLGGWREIRSRFEASLQPYKNDINAIRDFPKMKLQIEQQASDQKTAVLRQAEADLSYLERKQEKQIAVEKFEDLQRKAGNRPITTFGNSYLYWLILALITALEWKINFDFFLDWVHTPAVAAGFTIAMALGVAFPAHIHGEYLKQKNSRFGPHSQHIPRNLAYLGLATLAVLVAVGLAGYARYVSVLANLVPSGETNIGDSGSQTNQISPLTSVFVSLGINLIVWAISVFVAYMSHDEDHELMDSELERWRKTRRFDRKHRPWVKRIRLIEAEAERNLVQLQRQRDAADRGVSDQRMKLEQIEARERDMYQAFAQYAQPIVNFYQSVLADSLQEKGHCLQVGDQSLTGQKLKGYVVNLNGPTLVSALSPRHE